MPALSVTRLEGRDLPAASFDTLPILNTSDPGVTDTARAIYTAGAAAGRSGDIFLKVGDSNTDFGGYAPNQYLNPLATSALYGLSNYGGTLTDTVATYRAGGGVDSFLTNNGTAYPGFTVPLVLSRLPAALASSRAGVALVMLGTNDLAVYHNPEQFRAELTSVVSQLTAAGVVPVLSTVPEHLDNAGYAPLVRQYDQVIADVADAARVPLWNLWRSLGSLPHAGLDGGGVHLNASPNGGGSFFPADMLYGQNVRNVQAVQALDWFRLAVAHGPPATPATPAPAAEWTPVPVREPVYAVGRDAGQGPVVEVYDAATNKLVNRFLAYESSFTGGVRVATADIDGDGYTDVVTVPGVGGGPVVRVVSGKDGSDLGKLFAFEPAFRSGYTVTAGDLDGDGAAEVVVGAGAGGGPRVAVFDGKTLAREADFFAFDPAFRGGVSVAVGDFQGYGPSIAIGAGAGGGPVVKLFDATGGERFAFLALEAGYRGGINVAAGDLDGDGVSELAVGSVSGSPRVRVVAADLGTELGSFYAGTTGGARVGFAGHTLVVGSTPGARTAVTGYTGAKLTPAPLAATDTSRGYGVFVG